VAVASAFPTVARDLVRASETARRQHDRARAEHAESTTLAFVADHAGRASVSQEQPHNGELHVDADAAVHTVILQCADHFQAGAIANVGKARIAMAAEVALQDAAVAGAIEHRAPRLQLAHAIGRFFRVQFGHPPVVDVLAAAHRVGEVHFPAVAVVDVGERRRDATFRHDGVGFAEQRFADQPNLHAGGGCFDGGAKTGAAGADHENVVIVSLKFHESSRG
jgi:hypothetical protein